MGLRVVETLPRRRKRVRRHGRFHVFRPASTFLETVHGHAKLVVLLCLILWILSSSCDFEAKCPGFLVAVRGILPVEIWEGGGTEEKQRGR